MHSVSPVHIRLKNQLKNPMTAANFEDLIERKKKVKIGPSTVINESKKPKTLRNKKFSRVQTQKKKPVYQWTSPKKEKKCDLMKRCRLDDYISPIKQHIDEPSCEVCVDVKSRSRSRSNSPEKNGQTNCSFLRRLSSSTSPVSFSRSQEFDPNSTYTMPNRSKSHESYLINRENDLINPIDENDLILKKEFLVKKLIDSESFSSDIVRVLELIREYISNCDKGLDLKTVYSYLNKDIKSLFQLIDLFHLTHKDVRSIISEFLNPETLSMLRHVKENGDILNKSEKLKLENEKFRKIISEFEKNINQTGSTNEALNMENNVLASLKQSLEDNRAHLRRQLISREAECNRLSVQLRNLNRQLDRAKMEIELLRESREKAGLSALRFPTKLNSTSSLVQKPINQKSASTSSLPKSVKLEKNHFTFEEIISDPIKTRLYIEKLNNRIKEKDTCIKNLNDIIIQSKQESKENDPKPPVAHSKPISDRGDKTQIAKLMKENDKLKLSLQVKEDRLKNALKVVEQQKSEAKKSSTSSISEVSKKNTQSNSVSEDASFTKQKSRSSSPKKSQNSDTTIQREKNFSETEFNNVRSRLQQRLNELEPLPELLKNTELKLHEALSKIKKYEEEIADNQKCIIELRSKSETFHSKLRNRAQEKNEKLDFSKSGFNNFHQQQQQMQQMELSAKQAKEIEKLTLGKLEPIERRIQNLEEENKELIRQLGFKDDLIRDLTNKLTVKSNEAASFSRQLDLAISDSNLREHQIKEKFVSKERGLLARLGDLESKLRSMELHSSVDRRDKDDLCQDYQTQIRDLRYKLEQTQQTNKQMQEYVNFLKNSYITYFNDNTLQSFDCTPNASSNFLCGTSSNNFY